MKRTALRAVLTALPLIIRTAARRHTRVRAHLSQCNCVIQVRLRDGSLSRQLHFRDGAVRALWGVHAAPDAEMVFASVATALAMLKPAPDYARVIDALKNFNAMAGGSDRHVVWFGTLMHLIGTSSWQYGTRRRDGTVRYTNLTNGGPLHVDVRDGRIVRTLPIDLDEKDGASFTIEARGRRFTPRRSATVSPHALALKSLVYSPRRLLYPMKRVGFDPRGAIDYQFNEGFETTGADSKNDISARLSSILKPLDNLTVYVYGQLADKFGNTENLVNKGTNPATGAYCEPCFLQSNPWNDTRTGQFATPYGTPEAEKNHYRTYMVGAQVDYNFGNITLSYIPSYLFLDAHPLYWLSAIESTNIAHYNQLEQELRLSGDNFGLKWLLGVEFFNSRNSGSEYLFTNEPFSFYQTDIDADRLLGYAGFGQATYSVTDSFRIIGGARASSTQRTANGYEVVALGGLPYTFDKTYDHVDWKAGVEQDLAPSVMVYAIVQTGFQAGTFNALPNTATYSNEVKPEELRSYTVGLKSRWLDERLQINDELYYYDFHNLIIQAYDISAPYNLIFNGDKVGVKGNQLDILARVFSQDQLHADVSYSRARNVRVVDTNGVSYNGLAPAYTPDWVIEGGYTHNIPLGAATLRAEVNWRYESQWWADYVHNKGTEQSPDNKVDMSLTYDHTNWTVGAWVKNVSNNAVIAATAAAGIPGPATAYMEDPRTYGVRVTVKY